LLTGWLLLSAVAANADVAVSAPCVGVVCFQLLRWLSLLRFGRMVLPDGRYSVLMCCHRWLLADAVAQLLFLLLRLRLRLFGLLSREEEAFCEDHKMSEGDHKFKYFCDFVICDL
jgi:hypothetical protein